MFPYPETVGCHQTAARRRAPRRPEAVALIAWHQTAPPSQPASRHVPRVAVPTQHLRAASVQSIACCSHRAWTDPPAGRLELSWSGAPHMPSQLPLARGRRESAVHRLVIAPGLDPHRAAHRQAPRSACWGGTYIPVPRIPVQAIETVRSNLTSRRSRHSARTI
jgi:hypothetical protein